MLRASDPYHTPALDNVMAVGYAGQRLYVFINNQDRLPTGAQPFERTPNFVTHAGRQTLGRFVQNEKTWIGHQGTANGEHLLFASRQQVRHAARPFGEARKQRHHLFERPWLGDASVIGRGCDEILAGSEIWKYLPTFRNQADAALGDPVGRK